MRTSLLLALRACLVLGQGFLRVKPIDEVVRGFGYHLEMHRFSTLDGYILTYHRLRPRNFTANPKPRKVVLFNNGILLSSATLLANNGDLAYGMVDAGMDVWLGNYRGNMYSRRHRFLDPDRDPEFWDFSIHEFGTRDLPASFEYILRVSGARQLVYVGASMGTTMFWVLGSTMPSMLDKVSAVVAIAPVARPSGSALVNRWPRAAALGATLRWLQANGYYEVLGYRERRSALLDTSCSSWLLRPLCIRLLQLYGILFGEDWDEKRVFESSKYGPAGIATKVLLHFWQIAKARRFQQFDYGSQMNLNHYGTELPPQYNLSLVDCNSIYFVHSDADAVAAKEDVEWLSSQLPRRPTRVFADVNHLGHVGLALDRQTPALLAKPLIRLIAALPDDVSGHADADDKVNYT